MLEEEKLHVKMSKIKELAETYLESARGNINVLSKRDYEDNRKYHGVDDYYINVDTLANYEQGDTDADVISSISNYFENLDEVFLKAVEDAYKEDPENFCTDVECEDIENLGEDEKNDFLWKIADSYMHASDYANDALDELLDAINAVDAVQKSPFRFSNNVEEGSLTIEASISPEDYDKWMKKLGIAWKKDYKKWLDALDSKTREKIPYLRVNIVNFISNVPTCEMLKYLETSIKDNLISIILNDEHVQSMIVNKRNELMC